jgi:signal peptidase I
MAKIKNLLKQLWFLVWKDESWKGWVVSLLFIFIIVKFIFFPLLNFVTGTSLPLVVVESCSMYHQGNLFADFNQWWQANEEKYEQFSIARDEFQKYAMKNGFNKGDIILSVRANPERLKQGDIIIFNAQQQHPIIHRIVEANQANSGIIFATFGDNNQGQLPIEKEIEDEQIIGRAILKIPYIGWVKLFPVSVITAQPLQGCS